jgi:transketolase
MHKSISRKKESKTGKVSKKLEENSILNNPVLKATREGFGEGLLEAAKKNNSVYAVTADVAGSVGMSVFSKELPNQFVEVGVAEQNLVTVSAGLAAAGKIPFAAAFAAFSPGRNWEQIRTTIAYNNLPVVVVGSHVGLGVGEDGATHQMLEDIALMRSIPNMQVIVPCDAIQAKKSVSAIVASKKPTYLRIYRQKSAIMTTNETEFKIGKIQIFKEYEKGTKANASNTVCIISCGPQIYDSLVAAEQIEKSGINSAVLNCHTIKPLDGETIVKYAKNAKLVVVVEDHQIAGGLGGAVSEFLSANLPKKMLFIGMKDSFGESGDDKSLYKKYGLDANSIANKIRIALKSQTKK